MRSLCPMLLLALAACDGLVLNSDGTVAIPGMPPGHGSGAGGGATGGTGGGSTVVVPGSTVALGLPGAYGRSGLRRLTRRELAATVQQALGVAPGTLIDTTPDDIASTIAFENEWGTQPIDTTVIGGYDTFASAMAATALATRPDYVRAIAGCTPTGAGDRACFTKFAQLVGRRLLRRTVTAAEAGRQADLLMPHAMTAGSFNVAAELLLTALLQHPEVLYRVEGGRPASDPSLRALDDFEIATRMAFFIWGRGPDDALLDAAAAGMLQQPSVRAEHARRMFLDPSAQSHWSRFHGEWLGYATLTLDPTLSADMRQESDALVKRVAFEPGRDWMTLFSSDESFLTPQLAQHYGEPAPGATGFVKYQTARGGGILAHGTFLALGAKFADTSPTLRGYEVFKRITCGKLGSPPDFVDIDNPPGAPGTCKTQSYSMRQNPTCAGCHNITDGIGFGLENFSATGAWRSTEPGNPQCQIDGQGSFQGTAYTGPKALGELIAKSPDTSSCAVTQLFRFMNGRREDPADVPTVLALAAQYQNSRTLQSIVVAMVETPAITFRSAP